MQEQITSINIVAQAPSEGPQDEEYDAYGQTPNLPGGPDTKDVR